MKTLTQKVDNSILEKNIDHLNKLQPIASIKEENKINFGLYGWGV